MNYPTKLLIISHSATVSRQLLQGITLHYSNVAASKTRHVTVVQATGLQATSYRCGSIEAICFAKSLSCMHCALVIVLRSLW